MAELKKTIQINPDFLKFTNGGKTRKKRPESPKPIKMKQEKTENNKTTKRKILKYIRQQQEDNYKQLMKQSNTESPKSATVDTPKSDFEQSLEFLSNIAKQTELEPKIRNPLNATLKSRPPLTQPNSVLLSLDENVAIEPPQNVFDAIVSPTFQNDPILNLTKPQYGCLKGGSLPTYRAWKNQTQRVAPAMNTATINKPAITQEQNRAEMRAFFQKRKEEKQKVEKYRKAKQLSNHPKQKRTLRRTFRVGKSKVHPRVSVLVSNRTIRNQIQSKCQALKEIPIEEVRKYLIKAGLIRVGSSSPNDVLRKMYESAMLMCGEIQNHNTENLLYNYLNNGIDI